MSKYGVAYTFNKAVIKILGQNCFNEKFLIDNLKREKVFFQEHGNELEEAIAYRYKKAMGRNVALKTPRTFTEYIQYYKCYESLQGFSRYVDKIEVKKWVSETIGDDYLIPVYGVWNHIEEVEWDKLPLTFVLKCNHGSGMNYVVDDKTKINKKKVSKLFKAWLSKEYAWLAYELQYEKVEKKVFAEKNIAEGKKGLKDYKIHCIHGQPRFIQVIDREKDDITRQMLLDCDWKEMGWTFETYGRMLEIPTKPEKLDEMLEIARKLSNKFKYVRVDLYYVDGKIYFGEMTFTPSGGYYPYRNTWNECKDYEFGQEIMEE